jgi:RNA polymerase sigma-32 factor
MINQNWYMDNAAKFPLLSREEERELMIAAQDGSLAARNKLITSNLRFVMKQAYKHQNYVNGRSISFDDLLQEGNLGLAKAIDRFDVSKGFRFTTYAVWWINAMMRSYVLANFSSVKFGTTQAERILFFKAGEVMSIMDITDPSKREAARINLANTYNVKVQDVVNFERRVADTHIFIDTENELGYPLHDLVKSKETDPCHAAEESEIKDVVYDAIDSAELNDRERDVVLKNILSHDTKTMASIAKEYNLSRERIRQIRNGALSKIRMYMEEQGYTAESVA